MKKIILLLVSFVAMFLGASSTFADSSILDYTYIDCYTGNDLTAVPFDHTKSYNTLKSGIEKSIEYINTNWNTPDNANNVVGKRYVIKVRYGCVFEGYDTNWISTNFTNGATYKNDILITSNSNTIPFGIKNLAFHDSSLGMNSIVFNGIDFLEGFAPWQKSYFLGRSSGIKITNSIIRLNRTNIQYINQSWYEVNYNYYQGNIKIENSNIIIKGDSGDTSFTVPGYIKNSKIDFIMPEGKTGRLLIYGGSNAVNVLSSNIINLGGQDLHVAVESLNNKFSNVKSFSIDDVWRIFLNNSVENDVPVNANGWFYTYNNIFTGGYSDANDIPNLRRNFSTVTPSGGGVGWIFRRAPGGYFEINTSDRLLYKEMTGNTLGSTNSPIYLIFQ